MVVEEINTLFGIKDSKFVIVLVGIVAISLLAYQISLSIRQAKVYTKTKELVDIAKEIKGYSKEVRDAVLEVEK